MKAYVFVTRKKNGDGYTNTSFRIQGEGLSGRIPVRVSYYGKPVIEPVMVEQIDKMTGKPALDKEGKKILIPKTDEQGNAVYKEVLNEDGNVVMRDENYGARVDVLSMFASDEEDGEVCRPVEIIKRPCQERENGDRFKYYAVCGDEEVPIEVVNFSTAEKEDYKYNSNCRKLNAIAQQV